MNPNREELLFQLALTKPVAKRAAWLDAECEGDPALRQRLDALLATHEQPGTVLATQAQTLPPDPGIEYADAPDEAVGQTLGRYKLLERIGEGGCGVVYFAEQKEPVRRKVALKVIKLGMDTKQVVARFEAERQALAMMDHPNIAKVLDAGTTDVGRPFFVMELVRGIRITDYCDQANLSTKDRLDLFIKVCQAIQHAHQKGIIHRDIKPSNILVTLHDPATAGVPKVIDFGIAKATQGELTDKTIHTQFQQFIGTPAYMSPEQAEMSGLDIDTRSDIYSLGVLLYELLAGSTPFDAKELMASGIDAMRKTIREKEPMRPSTRLASLQGEELTTTAKRRSADAPKLIHLLQGDLDWIVMKCLEKDRTRRYDTANGLAMDIQRHLSNEPVVARPPSTAYRIQKAWQRNRLAVGAGTAVVAALVAGLILAAIGWREARVERDKAIQARAGEEAQRKTAQANALAAQEQSRRAEKGEANALRVVYRSNMILAGQAWEQHNVGSVRELLEETEASPSRGFEWYYWQRQTHLELKTFRGHQGTLTSVAFSPDGRRIVTGSRDGTAKVWDVATGKELFMLKGHRNSVNSVAFSPDGERVATASADHTAKVWETATGEEVLTLGGHRNSVTAVAFSTDGQQIVTGSNDQSAKVWEAASGKELLTFQGHLGAIHSTGFSPDSRRIVTASGDNTAKLWEAASDKELLTLRRHSSRVRSAAFSPDGQWIVTASDDQTAKVWETTSGKELLTLSGHRDNVTSAAFSPDGQRIVTASDDQTVRIWEASSGKELLLLKGHTQLIRSVTFSPDGRRILTGSGDQTAKVWEVAPARERLTLRGHGTRVNSVAFSPDGGRIVTGSDDRTAKVWGTASGKERLTLQGHTRLIRAVAFSPDGQRIVTGSDDMTAKVWHAVSGGELLMLLGHRNSVTSVAFSPDGERIVTGSADNTAKVWEAASGKELFRFQGHSDWVRSAAFSPDGQRIVTGSEDGMVKVWEAINGTEVLTLDGRGSYVWAVAFSPDGRRIVAVSEDQTAKVWDTASGLLLLTFHGHGRSFTSVAFSPDGQRIVTGSADNTAKVWEAASGKELLILKEHTGPIAAVAFSPDGQRIVTGSWDATARVWEAATPEQVAAWQAEEQAARQQIAQLRQVEEDEAQAATEATARELAVLAGAPVSALKHRPSTQSRPLIPGDPGAIRQWLVLAPVPFQGNANLNLLRQQIPHEAGLRPRSGQHLSEAPGTLAWTPVRLSVGSFKLDFVELVKKSQPGSATEHQAAYAVAYLMTERPQTNLTLLVGSDDVARIYLNEKEIYRQLNSRMWQADQDEVSGVDLKAGLNVLVFKVANNTLSWSGSVRFLDSAGRPVPGLAVTLDP